MDAQSPHYTVLARRFRPQTFAEVVGQQHVASALRNAIQAGRVAHAYLFTGARGVGKTSMARILAKTLNCPNRVDGNPCNECEICTGIAAGHDVDVLEIDGASNRGIDDIRTLRSSVNVKSMRTHFKIYIIDEVHMLTKEAFNALLKTLEEPPPNVKFVFCTTEPNKVPDTILSRCQRFDFATIEVQNIITRLHEIAQAEGYEVEPAALELVARRAAGSMRDSQSLFDQLLAFGSEKITPEDVHRLLGTASDDRLITLAEALISRQRDQVLRTFDETLAAGVQLDELIGQLLGYLRDLMVLAAGAGEVSLLSVSESSRDQLQQQAEAWGLQTIMAALEILSEAQGRMFRATAARILAEMALVRISMLDDLEAIGALIDRLQNGDGPRQSAPRPAERPGTQRPGGSVSGANPPRSERRPSSPPRGEQNEAVSGTEVAQQASDEHRPSSLIGTGPMNGHSGASDSHERSGRIEPEAATGTAVEETGPDSEPAPVEKTGVEPEEGAENPPRRMELRPGSERQFWSQVLSQIDDMLRDHAAGAERIAISGPNQLDVAFPASYDFSRNYCERPEFKGRLERLATELAGAPVRLRFHTGSSESPAPAVRPPADRREDLLSGRHPVSTDDELVQHAMSIFEATVVRVEAAAAPPQEEE